MVTWLSLKKDVPAHDYWDQTLLDDLLKDSSPNRQIVVTPGARQGDLVDDISMELAKYSKVLVIITSDEEGLFPVEQLYHPDMKLWVSYPDPSRHKSVDGYLPIGYTPKTRELVKKNGVSAKSLDWFFAGQITHESRRELAKVLRQLSDGKLVESPGFAQGLDYEEYMQYMCRAKVIPCPGGPFSTDSFRLYEALEAGCIPISEDKQFWRTVFGEVPFPVANSWEELPELINHYKDRPDVNNKCQAWWILKKRELKWILSQS